MKGHMASHLQEIMEDTEIGGWKSVRDYNAAWLQEIEQGRAMWGEKEKHMKLRRALVWHSAATNSKSASISATTS